ncbi:MAG: PQQ-binding-like beta-propeller repeat protein [Candidatus Aenigmarchaeota archaeon]|nr:PQQ-binding-like beta-propeller repeat protein [Candidatus Aenigmarchaeota archaeon]
MMDFDFGFEAKLEEIEVKRAKRFERLWQVGEGGSISYTKLKGDVLYFGAADSYFYAVGIKTGKELWRFKAGGIITGRAEIADERIFFTTFDKTLHALDITTGKEIWRFRSQGMMFDGPTYSEGFLVIGTKGGFVHAVDAATGREIWSFRTGDDILSASTIHEGRVFIGSADSYFYCIDLLSGKEVWRFKTGDLIHNDIQCPISGNMIFFSSFDNFMYCLDWKNGNELWRFKTGKYGMSEPPLLYKDVLYQGTRDGILFAISTEGREVWRFTTGKTLTGPSIFRDRIYFGSEDGYLRCIDTDGKEIWRFAIDGIMWDIPSMYENKIIFGTFNCRAYALDADTGEELWNFTTSNPNPSPVPPPLDSFEAEVRKSMDNFETGSGQENNRYSGAGETINLSDYRDKSEYVTKSEYTHKSEYTTDFVILDERLLASSRHHERTFTCELVRLHGTCTHCTGCAYVFEGAINFEVNEWTSVLMDSMASQPRQIILK